MGQVDRRELEQLLSYLDLDPYNTHLLEDAAIAAANCRDVETTKDLLGRLKQIGPLSPAMMGLEGRLLMGAGQFGEAVKLYRSLLQELPNDTAVKSSLAWALVQIGDDSAALELLDQDTIATWPQGAELRLRLLHRSGDFDQAQVEFEKLVSLHPDSPAIKAAASVLATDLELADRARELASQAGDLPDAHATLGLLELGDGDLASAESEFARALEQQPDLARAWLGTGLVALARQDPAAAISPLRRGATIFGDHLGSWLAVGWAELLSGQTDKADETFQQALSMDPNFAESHGSVAVILAMKGEIEAARREAEIAMRLDRSSFSALLAHVLIASANGREETAQAIFERALASPIDNQGRTLKDLMSKLIRGV